VQYSRIDLIRETLPKSAIAAVLDDQSRRVFGTRDLTTLLREHRNDWRFGFGQKEFFDYLRQELHVRETVLRGKTHQQRLLRYLWRDPTPLEVAASMRSTAYLCHNSAAYLHGLTGDYPAPIYVNCEQSEKPKPEGKLTQEAIDRAFQRKQRQSSFAFDYAGHQIVLLSGKHTGNLEVDDYPAQGRYMVRATAIERTLIDLTVRPIYAGGVENVLAAYSRAKGQMSVRKLAATLEALDYVYPFHQAIGFYLQRAGYSERNYRHFKRMGMRFDFHLAHNLRSKQFDEDWRLFHPKGM